MQTFNYYRSTFLRRTFLVTSPPAQAGDHEEQNPEESKLYSVHAIVCHRMVIGRAVVDPRPPPVGWVLM